MEFWYVFHTKPHKERQVAAQLHQRHYDVFLPLTHFHRSQARVARERPYFPCYLFARIDLAAVGPSAVQWLPGLRQLVHFGGQPAILPDHCILELQRHLSHICAAGGLRPGGLDHGALVRIVSGPFAGYEGLFDRRLNGTERVRVLLDWVTDTHQQQTRAAPGPRPLPVELSMDHIERVRRKP